jgi:hypothetical protein
MAASGGGGSVSVMSEPAAPRPRHPRGALAALGRAVAVAGMVALSLVALPGLPEGAGPSAPTVSAAQEGPPLDEPAVPVRIRLPGLGIDLPVVSSERNVRGNRRGYPLCDVAQYWTIYDLPGAPGTTWIYAHAQPGMFLPLLEDAVATGGDGLEGELITLQLRDGRLLRYRVSRVKQHALDRRIARRDRPGEHRLVLQTSEGPPGTIPKLQVAARLLGATTTEERPPRARPRACWQPRTAAGADRGPDSSATGPTADGGDGTSISSVASMAIGGGAVLLGAVIFAVYLVRRPPATARRRT